MPAAIVNAIARCKVQFWRDKGFSGQVFTTMQRLEPLWQEFPKADQSLNRQGTS
ncbi:MAG: hypothetical protein ISS15_15360 [Alphaproteobacteria bacterium]|nr:hypothetical protein [Alphaproteobacteria bacterium]MBL7099036.1 hypothetical protein [Alphaproteobacteria bacterium]